MPTPALTPSLTAASAPASPAPVLHFTQRWRKPVSFLFAAAWFGAALFIRPEGFQDTPHSVMQLIGFLLLIVAALGRVWAFAYIGGRKNQELCRAGPYSLTRNPLYFFSFLGVCGAGLALQSLALSVAAAGFFLVYYTFVIRAEEIRLEGIFGTAFANYRAEVPRFWPRWRQPESPAEITIPTRLLQRCLLEVFWFLAAIVLIEFIELAKLDAWWAVWPTRF